MKNRTRKIRLWELLVNRGVFKDRKTARGWIMAGKVIVDDERIEEEGRLVLESATIRVKGIDRKYVGRGGLKLESALSEFHLDVSGRVVLDVGASTGGFTDCLLQHGARKVYAVDVGYGQLAGSLRVDPRVVNMERINISDVSPGDLDPVPSLATMDLSYISLGDAIPVVASLLEPKGEMVCLVKPLFEVSDSDIRRSGRIKDPRLYVEVIEHLVERMDQIGFTTIDLSRSSIDGHRGTREFFLRVSLGSPNTRGITHARLKQVTLE